MTLILFIFLLCMYKMFMFIMFIFFFKQKTAYEMRISDWSSDVCSSDLVDGAAHDFGDRPGRDLRRDAWFRARGLALLRVPATDVMRDADAVVCGITALAAARLARQE